MNYQRAPLPIPASRTNVTEQLVTGFDNPKTFTARDTAERRTPLSEKKSAAMRIVSRGATQPDRKKAGALRTVAVQTNFSMRCHNEEYAGRVPTPARRYTF
jgi:hypothetical protein